MIYTIIWKEQSYDLPPKTLKVVEAMDKAAKVDSVAGMSIVDKFKTIHVYDFEESDKQGKDVYTLKSFYVLSRTLKGIQSMTDTLSAQGEEKQRRFVSDLGVREDVSTAELKEQVDKNTEDIGSHGDRIDILENNNFSHVLVEKEPETGTPRTIYYVKGTKG